MKKKECYDFQDIAALTTNVSEIALRSAIFKAITSSTEKLNC